MADFDEQKEREAFNAWCISNAARPEQCKREWFGWSARGRHQPSAPALPVEAIRVAIDMFDNMASATVTAHDALKQPSADVLTAFNREVFASMASDLRALLPPAEK